MSNFQQPKSALSGRPMLAVVVVVALVLAAVGGWLVSRWGWEGGAATPSAALPPTAEPGPPASPPAAEAADEPLPPLPESDPYVRGLVGRLSSEPELASWLAAEDLLRRFATTVNNLAEGESPRAVLPLPAPSAPFQVLERERRLYIHPSSYERYNAVARVLASLDTRRVALTWRALEPLLERASAEISRPGQRFSETLSTALHHLLAVQVPEGEVELVQARGILYRFADPALEALSPAQKHLLRMGPANARAVQAKLRELQQVLALPAARR